MTEAEVMAAALADPDAKPLTPADFKRMKRIPRAKIIRRALRLTQEEFAARFRIPLGTLRDWEQGAAEPALVAAVRDAFSNRIVGWRCSDRCDTDLILGALEYAVWTRKRRKRTDSPPLGSRLELYVSAIRSAPGRPRDSRVDGFGRRFLR